MDDDWGYPYFRNPILSTLISHKYIVIISPHISIAHWKWHSINRYGTDEIIMWIMSYIYIIYIYILWIIRRYKEVTLDIMM